ncbi:hypothetical protein CHS0354_013615 [Potamilus streckersoni]|uniref:Putative 2'-deoxynucleoside 5'-phosphate N-hydrolase 1 n=1 Tax=Potamilus streckersoni TaxID=2493646 RepID=A0AAE0SL45_9BIVA|nr:hypothetical protein CHS0354_013615 [Potamilus streckersoni]
MTRELSSNSALNEMSSPPQRKIYFCGSIHGGRQDQKIYETLILELKQKYGKVLTEIVGEKTAPSEEHKYVPGDLHRTYLGLLQECDAVVAEVTQPSLGVGYEIGRALTMGKKILCLFRPDAGKSLSCMIRGLHDGKNVIVRDYSIKDAPEILAEFFSSC